MNLVFNVGLMFSIRAWDVYMKEQPPGSVSKYMKLLLEVDPRIFDAIIYHKLNIKKL